MLAGLDDRPDAQLARGLEPAPDGATGRMRQICLKPSCGASLAILKPGPCSKLPGGSRAILATSGWSGSPGFMARANWISVHSQLAEIAAALRIDASRQARSRSANPFAAGRRRPGQLFVARTSPKSSLLTNALADAIRQFVGNLPAADPRHPLLKHRNMGMAFGPSWSVRFTERRLSCRPFPSRRHYQFGLLHQLVPDTFRTKREKPGWLEIGRPPPELGLDLPPLATFEPKPGRLVLFPSFLFHGTRPFTGGERMTVAFDLVPVPSYGPSALKP